MYVYVKPCETHKMRRLVTEFDLETDTLHIEEYCTVCGMHISSDIWQCGHEEFDEDEDE